MKGVGVLYRIEIAEEGRFEVNLIKAYYTSISICAATPKIFLSDPTVEPSIDFLLVESETEQLSVPHSESANTCTSCRYQSE